jgi:hypothetical protein
MANHDDDPELVPTPDAGPELVTVEVLEPHTYDGVAREVGTTYEVERQYVEFLELSAKWVRQVADDKPKRRRGK